MSSAVRTQIVRIAFASVVAVAATAAQASVEISSAATKHMHCKAGVCSPTGKHAVLNVNDLTGMLASDDVEVTTGNGAVTITVSAPFTWASGHGLTLDVYNTVSFRAPVTVAGPGAVTIVTNDGGTGGDLIFFPGGRLDFWDTSSGLVINGQTYLLVRDLKSLSQLIASNASAAYAMIKHFKGGTYTKAPIDTLASGIVEGLGHTVNKLNISQSRKRPCVGLFGTIAIDAIVRDVRVTHANIVSTANGRHVGALAGCNSGAIANAGSDGLVQGVLHSDIGGLVGNNAGTISNSVSAAQVVGAADQGKGLEHTGGLVGFNSGNIMGSSATGDVSSGLGSFVGGLVGWSNSGTISKSHARGAVTNEGACCGGSSYTGGLVGALNPAANVDQSYAAGTVHGGFGKQDGPYDLIAFAGGLVGVGSNITNSYALGSITDGDDYYSAAGGLVADGDAISNSYSVGSVGGELWEGGFIGYDEGDSPLSTDYWDLDTSGISNPHQGAGNIPDDPGIMGVTDAQLKSGLPAGFDPAIWGRSPSINNGYPYLLANPPQQ